MRTSNTFHFLPKRSRQLAVLLIPFMLNALLLNLAPTSRAEEPEETMLSLEIITFEAISDPMQEGTELYGQIQSVNPDGLTITFTGAINGTATIDSGGYFDFIVFGPVIGHVTATVTQGTETATEGIDI